MFVLYGRSRCLVFRMVHSAPWGGQAEALVDDSRRSVLSDATGETGVKRVGRHWGRKCQEQGESASPCSLKRNQTEVFDVFGAGWCESSADGEGRQGRVKGTYVCMCIRSEQQMKEWTEIIRRFQSGDRERAVKVILEPSFLYYNQPWESPRKPLLTYFTLGMAYPSALALGNHCYLGHAYNSHFHL